MRKSYKHRLFVCILEKAKRGEGSVLEIRTIKVHLSVLRGLGGLTPSCRSAFRRQLSICEIQLGKTKADICKMLNEWLFS
jgi:hypothetical protein